MAQLFQMGVPLNKLLQVYRPDLLPEGGEGYSWGDTPPLGPVTLGVDREDVVIKATAGTVKVNSGVPAYGSDEHKKKLQARDRKTIAYERRLRGAVRVAQKEIVDGINKRLSQPMKALAEFDDEDYIDVISRAYASAGVSAVVADAYAAAGLSALKLVGMASIGFSLNSPSAEKFLAKREQRFAVSIPEDQWKELKASLVKGMQDGLGTEGLKKIVEDHPVVSPSRAEMVARTEVIGAYNGGLEEGWKQSELKGQKVWLAALDSRTRPSHQEAHGQSVPLNETFSLMSGAKGMSPGQTGVAEEDINCRCAMDFIPSDE
jgi:SPP1 gp7 family putative phage head morphogenesis protein